MIPVYQTIIDAHKGNCMAACIASILELQLSDLPEFAPDHRQMLEINTFLRENYDSVLVSFHVWEPDHFSGAYLTDIYTILSGDSPNIPGVLHAVVGQGKQMVHDPNPSNKGILNLKFVDIIIPSKYHRIKSK